MSFEVMVNMGNPNALCTIGLLSAFLESKKRDYVDLVSPFVLRSIPTNIDMLIEPIEIQNALREEFGFEKFPLGLIISILRRYAKPSAKGGHYIRMERQKNQEHKFYVRQIYNGEKFDNTRKQMLSDINSVINSMQKYFDCEYPNWCTNRNEARDMLIDFFESCGFSVLRDVDYLRTITLSQGKKKYRVAKYILSVLDAKTEECSCLLAITKGFLIYKAIYFFEDGKKSDFNSKLKGVTFYLDCSLLICVLGHNSTESEQSALELIELIRNSYGRVCAFEHTVAEAKQLLQAFAHNPNRKNEFRLDALAVRNLPQSTLELIATSVKGELRKLHIDVVPAPSNIQLSNKGTIISETAIENWLESNWRDQHSSDKERKTGSDRFKYDAESLVGISRLRGNSKPERIEECTAILVTQDPKLNKCIHELYRDSVSQGMDYAIMDIDAISLLWLSSYTTKSLLPETLLIANAIAASQLDQQVMDRAIDIAEDLAQNGGISKDAAAVLRSQYAVRPYLLEETQNDIDSVSEQAVRNTLDRFGDDLTGRRQAEQEIAIQEAEQKERNKMLRKCAAESNRSASKVAIKAKKCSLAIGYIILTISAILWVLKLNMDYDILSKPVIRWSFIPLDILSLLQIIDYFANPGGVVRTIAQRIYSIVYEYCYERNMKKYEFMQDE